MMKRLKVCRHPVRKRWAIALLAIVGILVVIDWQIRPLVKSVAANQAQIATTRAINDAVQQELSQLSMNYADMVKIERGADQKIVAITTDVNKTNVLKAAISADIQEKLSNGATKKISIPLGTLTGTEILNGRGPMVQMKISIPSSVLTEFHSTFSSAGINQTKHQIYLSVNTKVYALIPGYPTSTTVETNIMIAETVIVGEVPSVFANVDPTSVGSVGDFSQLAK